MRLMTSESEQSDARLCGMRPGVSVNNFQRNQVQSPAQISCIPSPGEGIQNHGNVQQFAGFRFVCIFINGKGCTRRERESRAERKANVLSANTQANRNGMERNENTERSGAAQARVRRSGRGRGRGRGRRGKATQK